MNAIIPSSISDLCLVSQTQEGFVLCNCLPGYAEMSLNYKWRNPLANKPEFLMLPADLISVDYRLSINDAVWHFINMIRLLCVRTFVFNFPAYFWSKWEKEQKPEKLLSQEDVCLDFIIWLTGIKIDIHLTRLLVVANTMEEGRSLAVNCRWFYQAIPVFHRNWFFITKFIWAHN
jgi:hypothetical protein